MTPHPRHGLTVSSCSVRRVTTSYRATAADERIRRSSGAASGRGSCPASGVEIASATRPEAAARGPDGGRGGMPQHVLRSVAIEARSAMSRGPYVRTVVYEITSYRYLWCQPRQVRRLFQWISRTHSPLIYQPVIYEFSHVSRPGTGSESIQILQIRLVDLHWRPVGTGVSWGGLAGNIRVCKHLQHAPLGTAHCVSYSCGSEAASQRVVYSVKI